MLILIVIYGAISIHVLIRKSKCCFSIYFLFVFRSFLHIKFCIDYSMFCVVQMGDWFSYVAVVVISMVKWTLVIHDVGPRQWRPNEHYSVSNHTPHHCLLNRQFRRRSQKTSKIRVTGLCEGNSPVTGEFPAQMASNTEHIPIWWRHHALRAVVMAIGCPRCWTAKWRHMSSMVSQITGSLSRQTTKKTSSDVLQLQLITTLTLCRKKAA